jgi:ribonucleoside-diphosphate reductase beta chain
MASLEELAQQPDPGGRDDGGGSQRLMDPEKLYDLWENQHWRSQEIDFSQDKDDWSRFTEDQKDHLIWVLGSNYIGEERVSTQFAGLLTAYADHQEEAFLATQQVDESRHMVFFDRFYNEVIGMEGDDTAARIANAREVMNDSFVKLFDEELGEANRRLLDNPSDMEAKVDFVTVYHMVIEGTLALTAQKFSVDYLEEHELMPGFVEGFENVGRDEHRHVAYGTWFLQQTAGQDESLASRMQNKLQELLPVAQGVLVPTGQDPEDFEILGYSSQEINEFAFSSLSRRLKAIGVPLQPGENGGERDADEADS